MAIPTSDYSLSGILYGKKTKEVFKSGIYKIMSNLPSLKKSRRENIKKKSKNSKSGKQNLEWRNGFLSRIFGAVGPEWPWRALDRSRGRCGVGDGEPCWLGTVVRHRTAGPFMSPVGSSWWVRKESGFLSPAESPSSIQLLRSVSLANGRHVPLEKESGTR